MMGVEVKKNEEDKNEKKEKNICDGIMCLL